ncbi:hypothetical protein DEJ30_08115 [Curtobacterium sp. MCPF17_003]|uniref:hypothetical protein n=1 Tax=Curtobacterium sp. MCPF17_003 TaxID=2175637 RepID=UPI000DA0C054|nr:hypothetical protein [Curtobacterium sp. MCPF17_003]PYY64420.1 hypothetical protein DEJ30_08115 [Curtobacterium sp. MCPF17_003]
MTQTVGERLAETKATGAVSEEVFRAYAASDVSNYSSWGIWGKTTSDLSVFYMENKPWERLRSDVFFMGGNTGKLGPEGLGKFQNFHAKGHGGDGSLRNALTGGLVEGAYLTDIVKDYPTTDSGPLLKAIAAGDVDVHKHVVEPLEEELRLVNSPEQVTIILLGGSTVNVWNAVSSYLPTEVARRLTILKGVRHHSASGSPLETLAAVLAAPLDAHVHVTA